MKISRVLMALSFLLFGTLEGQSQTMVSFQTEDGWTLAGVLYLPEPTQTNRVPGVVSMSEPGGNTAIPNGGAYVAELKRLGIAELVIDSRGNGRNLGARKPEFQKFSPKDIDGLQLDIRAAVGFLASQKTVDPQRIGIVAPGLAGSYAVLEASENPAVQAIVLPQARLNTEARNSIEFQHRLPIYYLADPSEKESLREMAIAYAGSGNPDSVFVSSGTPIPREQAPAQWLSHNLLGLGSESEVSFHSTDGWTLHGILRMPPGANSRAPVAAVALAHGSAHDQLAYYDVARDLAKSGLAVLTFDWRGKGKSIDDEKWFRGKTPYPADPEWIKTYGGAVDPQMTKVYLDVQAAIEFLTTREGVDATRIGLVGATWSVDHVIRAAAEDSRVKTMVFFSPGGGVGVPKNQLMQYLAKLDVPILSITSDDDLYEGGLVSGWVGAKSDLEIARKMYAASRSKYSQLLVYEHGKHGTEILSVQPEVRPTIVRWFTEKLDKEWSKTVSSSE